MTEQGQGDGRLAGARLADEPEHLAGADLEAHLVDDVGTARSRRDRSAGRGPRAVRKSVAPTVGAGAGRQLFAGHACSQSDVRQQDGLAPARRSTPMATRAMASVKVLVPIVSRAMSAAGATTRPRLDVQPDLVLLDHVPQLGAGGGMPKPRKLSPAMITIE